MNAPDMSCQIAAGRGYLKILIFVHPVKNIAGTSVKTAKMLNVKTERIYHELRPYPLRLL